MNSIHSVDIIRDDFFCKICKKRLDRENDLFTMDASSGVICKSCYSFHTLEQRIIQLETRVQNLEFQ